MTWLIRAPIASRIDCGPLETLDRITSYRKWNGWMDGNLNYPAKTYSVRRCNYAQQYLNYRLMFTKVTWWCGGAVVSNGAS